jgi:hypothetical protein
LKPLAKPLPNQSIARAEALRPVAQDRYARAGRALLIAAALVCLVLGVWGGLVRLYWTVVPLASFNVNWVTFHGPLMVCGFLGTLIGVERATALGRWWAFAGPLGTAAGALALAFGFLGNTGPLLIVLGSLVVVLATCCLFWRLPSLDLGTLLAGSVVWFAGNILWYRGWRLSESIHRTVFWWFGFLLLTVFAERLELSRFLAVGRRQRALAGWSAGLYCAGLVTRLTWPLGGERIMGAAMVAMAAWLVRNDVARRNFRRPGLARFMAVCLLSSYAWLAIVGLALWMHEPLPAFGVLYDSILHAFFLGFVFSMIFAHAPIIFPAIVGVQIPFTRWLYLPLILLHTSLIARIVGDIVSVAEVPSWSRIHGFGGILNATAIALFLLTMLTSTALTTRDGARQSVPRP